jgi:hypothetical protein
MGEKTIENIAKEVSNKIAMPINEGLRFVIITKVRINPGTKTYVLVEGVLVIEKKGSFVTEFKTGKKWNGDTLCVDSNVYRLIYSDN